MRKQSFFLASPFFSYFTFLCEKDERNDVQSIFFSQGILEKNLFVQTAELLFIITGDMNISAYGALYRYDGNGIGSPFN